MVKLSGNIIVHALVDRILICNIQIKPLSYFITVESFNFSSKNIVNYLKNQFGTGLISFDCSWFQWDLRHPLQFLQCSILKLHNSYVLTLFM